MSPGSSGDPLVKEWRRQQWLSAAQSVGWNLEDSHLYPQSGNHTTSSPSDSGTPGAFTPTASLYSGGSTSKHRPQGRRGGSTGFPAPDQSGPPHCSTCTCPHAHTQTPLYPTSNQQPADSMSEERRALLYSDFGVRRNNTALSKKAEDYLGCMSGGEEDQWAIAVLTSGMDEPYILPPPDFKSMTYKNRKLYESLYTLVSRAKGLLPLKKALEFTDSYNDMYPISKHLKQQWVDSKGEEWTPLVPKPDDDDDGWTRGSF